MEVGSARLALAEAEQNRACAEGAGGSRLEQAAAPPGSGVGQLATQPLAPAGGAVAIDIAKAPDEAAPRTAPDPGPTEAWSVDDVVRWAAAKKLQLNPKLLVANDVTGEMLG